MAANKSRSSVSRGVQLRAASVEYARELHVEGWKNAAAALATACREGRAIGAWLLPIVFGAQPRWFPEPPSRFIA